MNEYDTKEKTEIDPFFIDIWLKKGDNNIWLKKGDNNNCNSFGMENTTMLANPGHSQ